MPFARSSETVELTSQQVAGDLTRMHVYDAEREVLSQALDLDGDGVAEKLIFQTDIAAKSTKTFQVRTGEPHRYRKEDFRVYGRFVRERFDDFAWENDRIAHRMYGAALETWQKEPLTSSAVDVWLKRTRRLVINDWYLTDDYHRDNGEGGDFYSAGKSRGCGGDGIWRDGKLVVSNNFRNSRVLAAGPIRLVFELEYPGFETKRISLDAGQNLSRFESRFVDAVSMYAVGIKKQPGEWKHTETSMRTWEPVKDGGGDFGCGIVLMSPATFSEADGNYLAVTTTPAVYYAGAGWTKSGDFQSAADWDTYINEWSQRIRSPLKVEIK